MAGRVPRQSRPGEIGRTLHQLELVTTDRDLKKAIRKALYTLSQRGIFPASKPSSQNSAPKQSPFTAFLSTYDGAGNRMVVLHFEDNWAGASTFALILVNDIEGPVTFSTFKVARKELPAYLNRLLVANESGIAVAPADPDYARSVIAAGRRRLVKLKKKLPDNMLDWMPKIGDPLAEHTPPIYAAIAQWPEDWHTQVDADPDAVFRTVWFDPWFLDAAETIPWLKEWEQLISSLHTAPTTGDRRSREEVIDEATAALITPEVRELYSGRLEESADVMLKCGETQLACQLAYHARELRSESTTAQIPFLRALVNRSLTAGVEMLWMRQKQIEEQEISEG